MSRVYSTRAEPYRRRAGGFLLSDAFYLEDMILVTETGHEVLSTGLPYTAEEIEIVMASGGGR